MRWTPGIASNIEDMRGRSGGMAMGAAVSAGGLFLLLVLSWATGIDLIRSSVGGGSSGTA